MKTESQKYPVLNVPNTLSFIRILVVPAMAYFFLNDQILWAVVMIAISGLSDAFDGFFARKLNQVTDLGKMLDPLADKLTQVAAAVCIGVKFPSLVFILMVFVAKEVLMAIGAFVLLKRHKKPCAARWYGKTATVLFYISVGIIVVMDGFLNLKTELFYTVSNILLGITAVMMVYAMIRYAAVFFALLQSDDPKDNFDIRSALTGRDGLNS